MHTIKQTRLNASNTLLRLIDNRVAAAGNDPPFKLAQHAVDWIANHAIATARASSPEQLPDVAGDDPFAFPAVARAELAIMLVNLIDRNPARRGRDEHERLAYELVDALVRHVHEAQRSSTPRRGRV